MKIVTENAVYIQKKDIAHLNQLGLSIPASIHMKAFKQGIVNIDDSNRYEFIKVEAKDDIDYFKNLDCIIDYNQVKNLTKDELIEYGWSIIEEQTKIAKKFNAMSDEEKEKNIDMVMECELLDYKMDSLREILWFKQGYIKMQLPIEVTQQEQTREKGLTKIIKTLFNRNKI